MNLKKKPKSREEAPLQKKIQRNLLQKYIGFLFVSVIVISGWLLFFYTPTQKEIHHYSNDVTQWMRKIRMATVPPQAIEQLELDTAELEEKISKIEKKIFYIDDMQLIAQKLLQYARAHRLKVQSMVPNYDVLFPVGEGQEGFRPLVKLPLELKMTGRYISVGRFVEDVHKLPFLYAPSEVFFEVDPELYPRVKVVVNGYLFLLNESRSVHSGEKRNGGAVGEKGD